MQCVCVRVTREPVTKSLLIFFSSCCSVNMRCTLSMCLRHFRHRHHSPVNMDLNIVRSLSVAAPSFSYCVLLSFVLPSIIIRCFLLAQRTYGSSVLHRGEIYWISHIMDLCWKILYSDVHSSGRGNFFPTKASRVQYVYGSKYVCIHSDLFCRFVANDHRQLLLLASTYVSLSVCASLSIQYRFEKLHKKFTVYKKMKERQGCRNNKERGQASNNKTPTQ